MNINLCNNTSTCFSKIITGDVFTHDGNVYIKTDERHDINAVNLYSGYMTFFTADEIVKRIIGSFVEEGADYDY